jgi:hypothetical protein
MVKNVILNDKQKSSVHCLVFTGGLVRKSMITRINHMTKIYVLCLF